jgi:phosphoserine phosphatase RsbU/P
MQGQSSPDPTLARLQAENRSLRRAVAELSVLNDISREIGALKDLEGVIRTIVEKSVAALGADQGVVTLIPDESVPVATTYVRSIGDPADRTPFHLDAPLIGRMQLHRVPLRLGPDDRQELQRMLVAQAGIGALLSAPLLVRGRLVGVLAVFRREGGAAFREEDERLLSIIGSQSAQILENARLFQEEQVLLRMQGELRVAYDIQMRLLPDAPPDIPGYAVAARTIPAEEVGGDFFDFIPLGESRTALCVGDVSGKGLPAALLMANAQATIRGQADAARAPAETVERVNWQVYRSVKRGRFLTLFYGELSPETHRFRYVNAGHNRPLLRRRSGEFEELRVGGVALGLMPRAPYTEGGVELRPGDALLVFSDGLVEAVDTRGEPFGEARLAEALAEAEGEPAGPLLEAVLRRVRDHARGAPPFDDLTALALTRR